MQGSQPVVIKLRDFQLMVKTFPFKGDFFSIVKSILVQTSDVYIRDLYEIEKEAVCFTKFFSTNQNLKT